MFNLQAYYTKNMSKCETCGNVAVRWFLAGWLFGLVSTFVLIVTLNHLSGVSYQHL